MIDGQVTSYFEWMGAGRYRPDHRSGAMHSSEPRIRDVYYGADSDNLYLRLDADDEFRFHTLEVRTEDQTVSLLENPAVQFAKQRITEIRVPFALFRSSARRDFQLGLMAELLAARIFIEH